MNCFVVIHRYDDDIQIEVFQTKTLANDCVNQLMSEYETDSLEDLEQNNIFISIRECEIKC